MNIIIYARVLLFHDLKKLKNQSTWGPHVNHVTLHFTWHVLHSQPNTPRTLKRILARDFFNNATQACFHLII